MAWCCPCFLSRILAGRVSTKLANSRREGEWRPEAKADRVDAEESHVSRGYVAEEIGGRACRPLRLAGRQRQIIGGCSGI